MTEEESNTAAFGVPQRHKANVPAFDPLLDAAREVTQSVASFRRELDRIVELSTNMHGIASEMEQSGMAPDAAKHVSLQVVRLRMQINKLNDYCLRLEGITAELSTIDLLAENISVPSAFRNKQIEKK